MYRGSTVHQKGMRKSQSTMAQKPMQDNKHDKRYIMA